MGLDPERGNMPCPRFAANPMERAIASKVALYGVARLCLEHESL
ncbi:MAG: hypothetical protein ACLRS8_14565 [Parabacteroides merdae]